MRKFAPIAVFAFALLCGGCATHTSRTQEMRGYWRVGEAQKAYAQASELGGESGDADELVWLLEEGATARAAGGFAESNKAFGRAFDKISDYENQPEISVLRESEAFLTNQSYLPYKGYNYDKIMLCTYTALNCIQTKDFDRAAVELKRLENFQREAKLKNIDKIEKSQKALAQANRERGADGYNVSKTVSNPNVQAALRRVYGDGYAGGSAAAGNFVNPFGYWLGGVFFASRPADSADRERAATLMRLCYESLGGKSQILAEDLATAEKLADSPNAGFGNITYVVLETGCAPIRRQVRIDLPIFIVAKHVPYVAVNFPYLEPQKSFKQSVPISADGREVRFETIADFDSIIGEEFNAQLPYVIAKTVLSAAAKATAQYFAARAAGDDWGLAVQIAGGIYQAMMNDADLRTWTTLPKQIRLARLETPASGKITVGGKTVDLSPKGVNIVYVKSMSASGIDSVRVFDFRDAPEKAVSGGAEKQKAAESK